MRKENKLFIDMSVDVQSVKQKTRIYLFLGSQYIHMLGGMIYVDTK